MDSEAEQKHVVILVHGIRDLALWQSSVRRQLEAAGLIVEMTNYGRFNLLQFLFPIGLFRKRAIESVWEQIRIVRKSHPGIPISVIAHSFGTYIIANIIRHEFDFRFNRVVFCGSVVPSQFPFQQMSDRFEAPILNEVGTADIWPAMAESVTWGYGSAGSFGFKRPLTRDRWHKGGRHGYFLRDDFCVKYWVPFLSEEKVARDADDPSSPSWFVQLIHIFPIKYLLLTLLLGLAVFAWPQPVVPDPGEDDWPEVEIRLPQSGSAVNQITLTVLNWGEQLISPNTFFSCVPTEGSWVRNGESTVSPAPVFMAVQQVTELRRDATISIPFRFTPNFGGQPIQVPLFGRLDCSYSVEITQEQHSSLEFEVVYFEVAPRNYVFFLPNRWAEGTSIDTFRSTIPSVMGQ